MRFFCFCCLCLVFTLKTEAANFPGSCRLYHAAEQNSSTPQRRRSSDSRERLGLQPPTVPEFCAVGDVTRPWVVLV